MSQPITFFCGYSTDENRTTNYCLVMLRMLYHENPKFLADVLSLLTGTELCEQVDVDFRQQVGRGASTPDGVIQCSAYTVFIETKTDEQFNAEQLENHLSALNDGNAGLKILIALSNFEGDEADRFQRISAICKYKYGNAVALNRVSFWDLVGALSRQPLPKYLANLVEEFRDYLRRTNLLPSWERKLFAVNYPDCLSVLSPNAYLSQRTWDDRRCKFFGFLQDSYVTKIAMIKARVDIQDDERATVIWQNEDTKEAAFEAEARSELEQYWTGRLSYPTRVFLLGPLFDTRFRNRTRCADFVDAELPGISTAEALADELGGKVWSHDKYWLSEEVWNSQWESDAMPVRFTRKNES